MTSMWGSLAARHDHPRFAQRLARNNNRTTTTPSFSNRKTLHVSEGSESMFPFSSALIMGSWIVQKIARVLGTTTKILHCSAA